jgi:integral membrane sensor domain MASE1
MWSSNHSIDNFRGGSMLMKIRLIGKFIAWMILGVLSRIIGSKSWIGEYFHICKEKFVNREPEIIMIVFVAPLLAAIIAVAVCACFGMPEQEAFKVGVITVYTNTLWNLAVLINVLWDKFIAEYERSFTILKESE